MENKNTIDISVFFKRWKLIVSFILVAFIIGFCRATFFSSPVYEVSRAYSIKNSATYSNFFKMMWADWHVNIPMAYSWIS